MTCLFYERGVCLFSFTIVQRLITCRIVDISPLIFPLRTLFILFLQFDIVEVIVLLSSVKGIYYDDTLIITRENILISFLILQGHNHLLCYLRVGCRFSDDWLALFGDDHVLF